MAPGKTRSSKRSSGTSNSSTITTVIFVALSVLGIWLLTSNSFSPPQTTSRTPSQITSISQNSKPNKDSTISEDVPAELLEDSTKSVDTDKTEPVNEIQEIPEDDESSHSDSSNESAEEVTSTEDHNDGQEKEIEEDISKKTEAEPDNHDVPVEENPEKLQGEESLQSCMHRVPTEENERGSQWPEEWPKRVQTPPYWLNKSQMGIYGKPAPDDFASDYEHWKKVVSKSYMSGLGITWKNVRNVMDMRAVYGGFAAALKDFKVWVMNVVNTDSPDTLPIIYERGLFGIYHDWCESFSTYPRTYDLLHADHLFSRLKKRCKLEGVMAEIDRIARPGGKLIVRDESSTVGEVENLLKSLHWEIHLTYSRNQEGILRAQKSEWRPESYAAPP